jgi:glycosyltransferase involved in cell wall biosynthesis
MVDELLQALKLLPTRFHLLMGVGGTSHRTLQRRLEELALGDRVRFLKATRFTEMLHETAKCDAGALLYQNSDLGNFFQAPGRLTEYLVNGLPVLASCHTGLEQLVTRFRIGECVDSRRPDRVAEGLLRLEARVRSGELTRRHCRDVFLSCFAVDNRAKAIVEAFEAVRAQSDGKILPEAPNPWWLDCQTVD